jgi:hypothetical protein
MSHPDPDDPGEGVIARWSWSYDYPEEDGGGFVSGEFALRNDGVLLRRMSAFKEWDVVDWWPGETDLARARTILYRHGYDLR